MSAEAPISAQEHSGSIIDMLKSIDARLQRMEERLDLLERRTNPAALEPVAATTVDILDGWIREAQSRGIDFDARGREVLALLERTTRPQTLRNLGTVLDHADAAPATIATVVDIMDGFIARQVERGIDPVEFTASLGHSLEMFSEFVQSGAFESLLDSGVFDPSTVELISMAGSAMVDERNDGTKPLGLFGAIGAMRNPDIQRTVGFTLAVARRLGKTFDSKRQQLT